MGRFTFNLPDIGEGIAEAEIVAWHVKPGDVVEEDQRIADMMTDKATVEMESPVAGRVVRVAGQEGDVIAIGSMLVEIETEGEAAGEAQPARGGQGQAAAGEQAGTPPIAVAEARDAGPGMDEDAEAAENPGVGEQSAPADRAGGVPASASKPQDQPAPAEPRPAGGHGGDKPLASPAVRARARELGVDLGQVRPSGRHIRHSDLDAYLGYHGGQGYGGASKARPDEEVRVIGMRRRIAENMAASKRSIPHFSYVEEFDVTELEAMRAALNEARGVRPKLTLLPFLITAICRTVPDFPMVNARYDDEAGVVTRYGAVHLGIATQTDAGLMVPVLRDAQARNIWQLATEISRLADAARSGKAKSEELSGGTITVTSLGPLGGIATTPVINKPEVAIIGPNKIVERPVFVDGGIEARKLMNLSISCDHRVVDGWDAASFVQALKRVVETPALLFVD